MNNLTAFIPARSGSTRIIDKNIKPFYGHPLIAYSIEQAKQTGIFADIWVSSDSRDYLDIASHYGARCFDRKFPTENLSPDIEWIIPLMKHIERFYKPTDYFAILRPTSPFRQPETIKDAWETLQRYGNEFDSLKAYAECPVNPYKIFEIRKHDDYRQYMTPLLTDYPDAFTFPTQLFQWRKFGAQVGFLDICKWENISKYDTHFGKLIAPFKVERKEALDINDEIDWILAEELVIRNLVRLVEVG